jgi:hypothetical protein
MVRYRSSSPEAAKSRGEVAGGEPRYHTSKVPPQPITLPNGTFVPSSHGVLTTSVLQTISRLESRHRRAQQALPRAQPNSSPGAANCGDRSQARPYPYFPRLDPSAPQPLARWLPPCMGDAFATASLALIMLGALRNCHGSRALASRSGARKVPTSKMSGHAKPTKAYQSRRRNRQL